MAKRRRLDSGDYDNQASWEPAQFQSFGPSTEYANAAGASLHDTPDVSILSENTNQDNTQWPGTGASPYPDVASFAQQPYFFQQTDPSAYNSPWPPADTATFGTQTSSLSASAPSAAMPFFPPQTTRTAAASENSFDSNASLPLQNYQSRVEPTVPQLVHASSSHVPQHSEGHPQQPALFIEDASMQMKVQSLPILDNLVRTNSNFACECCC